MLTLALDGAAGEATVAVLDGSQVLATAESSLRDRQVDPLLPTVIEALMRAGVRVGDLRRVVCGDGPGGFTALRLVGATAKGIVRGTAAELWVAPSLALIPAAHPGLPAGNYLALLDALRGECYAAHVTVGEEAQVTRCATFARVTRAAALEHAMTQQLTVVGPEEKVALRPHARGVARLAWDGVLVRRVNMSDWEPDYGRLADAQVRWEATHQRALQPLPDAGAR